MTASPASAPRGPEAGGLYCPGYDPKAGTPAEVSERQLCSRSVKGAFWQKLDPPTSVAMSRDKTQP